MQVIKIIKDTSKSRVFFYGKNDTLLFSADATASFSAEHTHKTVSINFEVEGSLPASFGWASDLIYLGVDATPPVLQTGTFDAFLTALKDTYFSQSASGGGGGGGGGGDATAAKQDEQTAFLEDLSIAAGAPTDSPTTSPSAASTQTALQKGIFANGLRLKSFDQVVDKSTNTEYLRAVDFDPNTPPAEIKYLDPVTGLQVTAPANPVQPIASNVILEGAIGDKTDAAETNPALDASMIALLKGIVSNTTAAPTASNHFRNSATTNSVLVKSGAGKVLSGTFTNKTTGTKYLRFYSFNSTPAPTLTPVLEVAALTGATVQIPQINGFVLGITYIISSSANQAGAQLTTADAASVQLSYI
jgi:hypothetical protein